MPCYRVHIKRHDMKAAAPYIKFARDSDTACSLLGAHDKKAATIRNKWGITLRIIKIEEI